MQRTIQQITQQLIDRLPDNDQYYRLDELRSWGFPSFVVRRIKIELERNLAESMIIPKTDWANTQSEAVQEAWQQFVDAIRAEARLPASYAKTVIETAVADVLHLLVQPRKNIPEMVFESDDPLSFETVQQRMKFIVVYPHFAKLIPRYMEKKELKQLSRERCKKIVHNADAKLTERYSPLNWAQMLEPLFKLVGGEIDTNLLRLFFEDKNMPRVARKLDLMNDALTRAELIEVLSSPDLLDFEGYEDEQSSLFQDQPESQAQSQTSDRSDASSSTSSEQPAEPAPNESAPSQQPEESQDSASSNEAEPGQPGPDEEPTINSGFSDGNDTGRFEEEDEEAEGSLNAAFSDPGENGGTEEEPERPAGLTADKDEDSQEDPEPEMHAEEEPEAQENQPETDEDAGSESQPQENGQDVPADGQDEETPIWMRYMSDEEIEEYQNKQAQDDPDEVEEGFIDDPVIDLTNEDASEQEIEELRNLLENDRELFVEEIFRGSDRAFDEAVEDIAAYDNWQDASKYIEKDIFKRNLVDMYSEAAVDFTDRLQTYFLEKQNQSK